MKTKQIIVLGLSTSALALAGTGFATDKGMNRGGTDLTSESGSNTSTRTAPRASWGDIDADGLNDAIAIQPDGSVRLSRNVGDGTFADVTAASGLAKVTGARVVLLEDLDGDGRIDLFVGGDTESRLFANTGSSFLDVSEGSGLLELGGVGVVSALDYDADGALDLLVTQAMGDKLFHNTGTGRFEPVSVDLASPASNTTTTITPTTTPPTTPPTTGVPNRPDRLSGAPTLSPNISLLGLGGNATTAPLSGPPPTAGPGTPIQFDCLPSIQDMVGGCLGASSAPMLGTLYPLGTEFNIDSMGRIGIGTTSPFTKVHVSDTGSALLQISADSDNADETDVAGLLLNQDGGGTTGGLFYDPSSNNVLTLSAETGSATEMAFRVAGEEHMRIANDGKVGIGTATPTSALSVAGTIDTTGSIDIGNDLDVAGDAVITGNTDIGGRALIGWLDVQRDQAIAHAGRIRNTNEAGSSSVEFTTTTGAFRSAIGYANPSYPSSWAGSSYLIANSTDFVMATNNTERMRLTSGGGIGIGTTTPAFPLDVVRSAGGIGDPVAQFQVENCGEICAQPAWTEAVRLKNTNDNGRVGIGFETGPDGEGTDLYVGTGDNHNGRGNNFVIAANDNGVFKERLTVDGSNGLVSVMQTLEIRGGADIVERFESSCGELAPGTVVAIDPENPGALLCSFEAYDTKVAGVVSGAGGVNPGLCLGQDGMFEGDMPVAMTGRVYVKCSTENGPIRPGDRLTTAALAGHAMKVADEQRSIGAVIGKAMSSLDEDTGLVLVLINLQ